MPACSRLNSVESRPSAERLESIGKLDPARLAASPVAAQYSSRFSRTTATATPVACVIFRKRSTITLAATCKSPACDRRNSCVSTIWARASVGSGLERGSTSKVFCSWITCAASRSCWNVASSSAGFSRSLMMVSSSWSRVPGLSGSAIGQCNSPSTVLSATPQPLDSSSLDGLEPYPNRCTQVLALLGIMASSQLPFVGPSSQPHLHAAPTRNRTAPPISAICKLLHFPSPCVIACPIPDIAVSPANTSWLTSRILLRQIKGLADG